MKNLYSVAYTTRRRYSGTGYARSARRVLANSPREAIEKVCKETGVSKENIREVWLKVN